MLQHDISIQTAMDYYRRNYTDCTIKYHVDTKHKMHASVHTYMQTFLFEASTYYLTLGFVVFRFAQMPFSGDSLVPIIVPMTDISWELPPSDYEQNYRFPEVRVCGGLRNDSKIRFYMYKFGFNGTYATDSMACGIVYRLVHIYRRLVHAQDYDLIIRNENLRKTVFVEQTPVIDKEVSNLKTSADRGELQAIMDTVRPQRITTHHAPPISKDDEFKKIISVKPLQKQFLVREYQNVHNINHGTT